VGVTMARRAWLERDDVLNTRRSTTILWPTPPKPTMTPLKMLSTDDKLARSGALLLDDQTDDSGRPDQGA
jgi:hypothetical protein